MIWVDLDGVLADFDEGYHQRFGLFTVKDGNPDEEGMWKRIYECGDFFLNLPWMLSGRELWGIVAPMGAHILTAVPKSFQYEASKQKIQWCQRELGIGTDRIVAVLGKKNKILYCQPRDILFDGNLQNCRDWEAAGGRPLLMPRNPNMSVTRELLSNLDALHGCCHSNWGRSA